MKEHLCKHCGYHYDPEEHGGVPFERLAMGWECPVCGLHYDVFTERKKSLEEHPKEEAP